MRVSRCFHSRQSIVARVSIALQHLGVAWSSLGKNMLMAYKLLTNMVAMMVAMLMLMMMVTMMMPVLGGPEG